MPTALAAQSPESIALLCGLLALRVGPLVLLAPWLLAGLAPRLLQLAITVALVVCLLPVAANSSTLSALPTHLPGLALLGLRELLIGGVLGLSLAVPLLAVQWAGELLGVSLQGGVPPDGASTHAPLRMLYEALAAALFVTLGGHRVALTAFANSLQSAPLAQLALPMGVESLVQGVFALVASGVVTATLVALPVIASLALSELLLSLVARFAELPWVAGLSGATRALVTLCVVWMGASALAGALPQWFQDALGQASTLWSRP